MLTHHISNVSNNTLNLSHNRLSSLSISYIEYFYHVFPLHLNSFNRLFSDVISPKLSILITSVTSFTGLTSEINQFISSLKGVSSYLNNNPAQELLNIIKGFDGDSYVTPVRSDINQMIDKLDVRNEYQKIIGHVNATQRSLVSRFNSRLKTLYENFKTKLTNHESTLKENIQKYLKEIKQNITGLCSCVTELIELICENIKNLKTNYSNLSKFDIYKTKFNLMKPSSNGCQSLVTRQEMSKLETIFKTHEQYKSCLKSCSEITTKLDELKNHLEEIKDCSATLAGKLESFNPEEPDTDNIGEVENSLKSLETNINQLNGYMNYVQKLEQIGGYITKMKNTLDQQAGKTKNKVKDKVDPEAVSYIIGLADITITKDLVEKNIKEIKGMKESVILELKIARSAIKFHELLKTQLTELEKVNKENRVKFEKYDISEFYKNSTEINKKLTSFQTTIESKINEAIETSKKEIEKLKKQCQEHQGQPSGQESESISSELEKLKNYYTQDVQNITTLRDNFLSKITLINNVLTFLELNKNQSVTYLTNIKCQVSKICNLIDATTKLTEIRDELNKFAKLQETTKSLISDFSKYPILKTLGEHSNKLQDSIETSRRLVGLIDYYIGYLRTVKKVDSIIKHISSCYESMLQRINQIFQNFKDYVNVITCKLETINCYLCQLKFFSCYTSYTTTQGTGNYDLGKLKYYMNTLKFYFTKIKTDFTTVKTLFDKIKQESIYIDQNKCALQRIENVIDCYIKCNNKQGPEKAVIDHLKSIKIEINIIPNHKYLIINGFFENKIKNIESKLNLVEKSINDLECAIEGVARNMIRCSLKSLSNHLTNFNSSVRGVIINENDPVMINYSLLNITNYNVVINNSLKFWSFSDEATKLFRYIRFCSCGVYFESRNRAERPSTFPYPLYSIRTTDFNPVSELARNTMADNVGNHLCLCLVIKYHLRPAMLKCILYLRNEDLGSLSRLSRKHDKYNPIVSLNSELWKIYCLTLSIIYKITLWIKNKYMIFVGNSCICSFFTEKHHNYFISIILILSSLIENIWDMDKNSILTATECLSSLLSEFDMISPYKIKANNAISDDPFKYLFCPINFCKISSKLHVILDFISFSLYDPYLSQAIKPHTSNLSLANPSFDNVLKHFRDRDINKTGAYFGKLLDKYNSIDSSKNICLQFRNQCCILSSNVMLFLCLLISCKIKAKLYSKKCPEIKERLCGFLKCVCDCEKNDCCIKQILESKDQICNGQNDCQKLLEKCVELCCENNCCSGGCPCKHLKDSCDKLKKMCCEGGTNGLCKILEEMSKCLKKEEGDKCNCSCCKIVIESILLIQEMFKLNVSNISKNIIVSCKYFLEIIDKIKNTKNGEIILKLVKEINERTIFTIKNKVKILKNNLNTYSDQKNIAKSFPSLTLGNSFKTLYENSMFNKISNRKT